ncbi:coiled-coil domain-containing protein 151 isoform X1 [Oryzias melastigma]|uniref:Trichohyalin-like n=2 Tax=Oryzias melastigma TaxID=30732 RepID=A0A3B3DZY5_ORYME|nr:coiled-coil domain-containing protein 151 isoform X1 [Oryzias melastigma]
MERKMSVSDRNTGPSLNDQTDGSHQNIQDKRDVSDQSFEAVTKKNTETTGQLREKNRRARTKLTAAQTEGAHIKRAAFADEETCSRMQRKENHATLQQQVFSKAKLLNSMKHATRTLQQHLDELKMEQERLKQQHSREAVEDTVRLRRMENSLETSRLKLRLVQSIAASTQKLINHFKDQSRTHEGQLDALEAEILKERGKLQKLQVKKLNAQLLRDACQAEQQQQQQKEELLLKDLKEKEQRSGYFIKKLKDNDNAEKTEKKSDGMRFEAQDSTSSLADEEKTVPSAYEEAFRLITDSTGITDVEDLVERFASQRDTLNALEGSKVKSKKEELELAEQLTRLQKELQEVKHQGAALLFSEQQNQEEHRLQLQAQQLRCDAAKRRLDSLETTLSTARSDVESLAQKLQHIEMSEQTGSTVPPDSPEFILELLTICKWKLQLLYDHLEGKDPDAIMEEMKKDKEFQNFLEKNLPESNVRIKRLDRETPDQTKEEDMWGVDEDTIASRETLKKKSQLIFESNTKKNPWKKKTTRM